MHGKWHSLSCRLQVLPLMTPFRWMTAGQRLSTLLESLSERTIASNRLSDAHVFPQTHKAFCATTCDTCWLLLLPLFRFARDTKMFLFSLYSLSLCYITLLIFFLSICLYTRLSHRDIFPPSKPFSKPATHVPWSVSWRASDLSVTFTNQRAKQAWKGQEKRTKETLELIYFAAVKPEHYNCTQKKTIVTCVLLSEIFL